MCLGIETAVFPLEGEGDFTHGGAPTRRLDRERQQIAFAADRSLVKLLKNVLDRRLVAIGTHIFQPGELRGAHRIIVDLQNLDLTGIVGAVFVDTDDDILAAVNTRLLARRCLFDTQLGHSGFNGLGHATGGLDFFNQFPGLVCNGLCQALHHVGPAPGIHHVGDTGFLLNDQLRVACDACREFGRQRNGLIEGIGMQ